MSTWSKRERFAAVLNGEVPDRTPVAAWGHFQPYELSVQSLADITARFTDAYDWDWIKINPRSSYYGEAWDTRFDHSDVDDFQPAVIDSLITDVRHVWRVHRQTGIRSKAFADNVAITKLLTQSIPDVPLAQTVFSPLTALLEIAGQPVDIRTRVEGSLSRATLELLLREETDGVKYALGEIAAAFIDYFERLKDAGASAIFYALPPAVPNPLVNQALVKEFSEEWDRQLLDAAREIGLSTILHICGPDSNPARFASLGADALSWDQASPLNPSITEIDGVVPVGGVNRVDIDARDVNAVFEQASAVERELGGRPHLLTPTCAINPTFGNPALDALGDAVAARTPVHA